MEKLVKTGEKALQRELHAIIYIRERLRRGIPAGSLALNGDWGKKVSNGLQMLTAKKALYVANVSKSTLNSGNEIIQKVEEIALKEGARVVVICGEAEVQMVEFGRIF